MLYSEKFHWLLIEDFAWHGRTQTAEGSGKRDDGEMEEEEPPGQQIQATDDEDLPSIESFLGGMNLYMNTELTLAAPLSRERMDSAINNSNFFLFFFSVLQRWSR